MAGGWGYSEFTEGLTNPLKWAIMQGWKTDDLEKRLQEQGVMRKSIEEMKQAREQAQNAAVTGNAPQFPTEQVPGRPNTERFTEEAAQRYMQLGGEPGVRSYEGIAAKKQSEDAQKLKEFGIKTSFELFDRTKGALDTLNTLENNENASPDAKQVTRDTMTGAANKLATQIGLPPPFSNKYANIKEINETWKNFQADVTAKAFKAWQNDPTTENEGVFLATLSRAKGAIDPEVFKTAHRLKKEELLRAPKEPEKPLRALKTLYGPGGRTQEVQVGEGYNPPPGWSLKAPFKPESDTGQITRESAIEGRINQKAHREAIAATKLKFGTNSLSISLGAGGVEAINKFENDAAENYYTKTRDDMVKRDIDRAIKLKQLPESYKIAGGEVKKPDPEKIMIDAKDAIKKGAPKDAIKKRLLTMGYTEKQLQSTYFNWLR